MCYFEAMKYTMVYFIFLQVLVYSFDKLKCDAWTFNTLLILMMIRGDSHFRLENIIMVE